MAKKSTSKVLSNANTFDEMALRRQQLNRYSKQKPIQDKDLQAYEKTSNWFAKGMSFVSHFAIVLFEVSFRFTAKTNGATTIIYHDKLCLKLCVWDKCILLETVTLKRTSVNVCECLRCPDVLLTAMQYYGSRADCWRRKEDYIHVEVITNDQWLF